MQTPVQVSSAHEGTQSRKRAMEQCKIRKRTGIRKSDRTRISKAME